MIILIIGYNLFSKIIEFIDFDVLIHIFFNLFTIRLLKCQVRGKDNHQRIYNISLRSVYKVMCRQNSES